MEQATEEAQRKFVALTQFLYGELETPHESPPRTLPATPKRTRVVAVGVSKQGKPYRVMQAIEQESWESC